MSPWWSKPTSDPQDPGGPTGPLSVADGLLAAEEISDEELEEEEPEAKPAKKPRRRRSRRSKDNAEEEPAAVEAAGEAEVETAVSEPEPAEDADTEEVPKPKKRSRRSAKKSKPAEPKPVEVAGEAKPADASPEPAPTARLDRPLAARKEAGRPEPTRPEPVRPEPRLDRAEGGAPSWGQIRDLLREIVGAGAHAEPTVAAVAAGEERKIALFCDLENLVLGIKDSESDRFDIELVLDRLVEKGKIIVKRAYADWSRYTEYKRAFHEAGIELIDIPQRQYSGKNSADIKMVVDAMDISWSKEHLDTFVILSGDSDFTPLVTKLKENDKRVIGVGLKASSSNLLIDNCDEFLYYEDLWRDGRQKAVAPAAGVSKKEAELATLLTESVQALERDGKSVLWGSMVKQTMQRKKPAFNESYYGYSTFSALLEDAEKKGIVKLRRDGRSGSWVITGLGGAKRA